MKKYTVILVGVVVLWGVCGWAVEKDQATGAESNDSAIAEGHERDSNDVRRIGAELGLSKEVVDKLSPEQLYDLLKRKIHNCEEHHHGGIAKGTNLVTFSFFAFIIIVMVISFWSRQKTNRHLRECVKLMLEKGVAIPPEVLVQQRRNTANLKTGLVLLFCGIGISSFFGLTSLWNAASLQGIGIGLIPLFLGIGYLIFWKMKGKDSSAN